MIENTVQLPAAREILRNLEKACVQNIETIAGPKVMRLKYFPQSRNRCPFGELVLGACGHEMTALAAYQRADSISPDKVFAW